MTTTPATEAPTTMRFITITTDPDQGAPNMPYVHVETVACEGETLGFLQGIVGGNVECLDLDITGLPGVVTQWSNDEGKLVGLPFSLVATSLVRNMARPDSPVNDIGLAPGDVIVGNTVLTGFDPDTGETIGLTDAQHAFLIRLLVDTVAGFVKEGRIVHEPAVTQDAGSPLNEPTAIQTSRDGRSLTFVWDIGTEPPEHSRDEPSTCQVVLSVTHFGSPHYHYEATLRRQSAGNGFVRTSIHMGAHPLASVRIARLDAQRFSAKTLATFAESALAGLREVHDNEQVVRLFTPPRLPANLLQGA